MAHFAKLNEFDVVVHIDALSNDIAIDEATGIAFLDEMSGTAPRVQCSYNGNFRKQFPVLGSTYDRVNDRFIAPQIFPSWSLDANGDWRPPVARPTDGQRYLWNEAAQQWEPEE